MWRVMLALLIAGALFSGLTATALAQKVVNVAPSAELGADKANSQQQAVGLFPVWPVR